MGGGVWGRQSRVLRQREFLGWFLCSGREQVGHRIRAITLFGLQGSYLFARFDMFLLTGGAVQYGKPIALKCIYLFCRWSRQTEQD